jgi:hypothetical protein
MNPSPKLIRWTTLSLTCVMLTACGDTAKLSVAEGTGPQPKLVAPNHWRC